MELSLSYSRKRRRTRAPYRECRNIKALRADSTLRSERIVSAAEEAGLPVGVIQFLHSSHALIANAAKDGRFNHIAFTGSFEGGRDVQHAMMDRFIILGLELGGKDTAYVCADADLPFTIDNVVDGAFFNSGQSCCGIERVYVDAVIYDRFFEGAGGHARPGCQRIQR